MQWKCCKWDDATLVSQGGLPRSEFVHRKFPHSVTSAGGDALEAARRERTRLRPAFRAIRKIATIRAVRPPGSSG